MPQKYEQLIEWIVRTTGLTHPELHIHCGMAILLLTRLVTGRRLHTMFPLFIVALAEGLNETMDRLNFGSWRPADTLGDIANTLFWPTILSLSALAMVRARRRAPAPSQQSDTALEDERVREQALPARPG